MTKYEEYLLKLGIYDKKLIEKENVKITPEAFEYNGHYYVLDKKGLSDDDISKILAAQKNVFLKKIKNMLVYFTTISVIGLLITLINIAS